MPSASGTVKDRGASRIPGYARPASLPGVDGPSGRCSPMPGMRAILLEGRGGGIVEAEGDFQAGLACEVSGLVVEVGVGRGRDLT